MKTTTEKAPLQATIDELGNDVTSPEDQAILDSWKKELAVERGEAIIDIANSSVPKLEQLPDGTVVTHEEAVKDINSDNPTQAPRRG